MKILFLTRLYLPHVGGVEKHIYEISKILSKNHHITIIAEQDNPSEPEYEKTDVAEVYRIPLNGVGEKAKKWVIWKWLFKHRNLIDKSDLIHIHDVFFWYLPFRILFTSKKVFITFHGYEGDEAPTATKILWHHLASMLTNGNICIGDFHKKWYGIKPTLVSYGAVNRLTANPHQQKKDSAVFIGRLSPDNGIMDYLSAIKILKIPLDVYGDGPQKDQAIQFIKLYHLPVKLLGFVPDSSRYISNYKYAFISRYLGILEALNSRVPIIAHYNNSIKKDYLGLAPFARFICLAGNSDQIVASVSQIRDNYPTASLKAGYDWAITQTWPKLANDYETLWTPLK